jgi:hypothetical protein
VACDFCVVVTVTLRLLYDFVVMEHATHRILHTNVIAHPTATWTLQQLREAMPAEHGWPGLLTRFMKLAGLRLGAATIHEGLPSPFRPPTNQGRPGPQAHETHFCG